jgi:hypothetical protein
MADANYLRERARRCRALSQIATDPEVIRQLQVWAIEFDLGAEAAEQGRRRGPGIPGPLQTAWSWPKQTTKRISPAR